MLVLDASKRYTIAQVQAHKWMAMTSAPVDVGIKCTPPAMLASVHADPCENILRLMQQVRSKAIYLCN
jgi:hypothetical protein